MMVRWGMTCVLLATMATGCTFGLGEETSFATRNLTLSADLADGTFTTEEGTVTVAQREADLERGVVIYVEGVDGAQAIDTTLDFQGNLGALCPGSEVELEGEGDSLRAVSASGAPEAMLAQLRDLRVEMRTLASASAGTEDLRPLRVTVSSHPGEDGFSVMRFTSTTMVDDEQRTVSGQFDIAVFVEETAVPGWEGNSWNGQPIDTWE